MLTSIAAAILVVWCFLAVQTIVNLLVFRRLDEPDAEGASPRVSIVIPARNEERYIGRTLDAALRQDYPDFEVIVVDDGSTDGTAAEIHRRARDPRLVVATARPLEPGWLGKPNALATGAALGGGDFLLFMDADVELHPRALRDSVAACERNGWDYLTLLPYLERRGFWEEILMPILGLSAFLYLPTYLTFVRRSPLAAGGGAFGLTRRKAYEAIGGHRCIRSSVVDDIRLAMEIKSAGFRTSGRLGLHRVRLRMYHGRREIVEGFTKNAHAVFGDSTLRPLMFLLAALVLDLTPFLWPLDPSGFLGAALLILLSSRALVHLRLDYPLWPILLSPLLTASGVLIVLRSLRMARQDGVVRWRGREYPREMTEF
jgi:chlorobactene glucosyltransferase